jgi:hypothetical protein
MTKIWTAVAERSGDTAFRAAGCFQKRRGASLPAAVQNLWLRRKPRWVNSCKKTWKSASAAVQTKKGGKLAGWPSILNFSVSVFI